MAGARRCASLQAACSENDRFVPILPSESRSALRSAQSWRSNPRQRRRASALAAGCTEAAALQVWGFSSTYPRTRGPHSRGNVLLSSGMQNAHFETTAAGGTSRYCRHPAKYIPESTRPRGLENCHSHCKSGPVAHTGFEFSEMQQTCTHTGR